MMKMCKRIALTLGLLLFATPCFAQVELAPARKTIWGIVLESRFNDDFTQFRFGGFLAGSGRVLLGASFGTETPHGQDAIGLYGVNVEIIAIKSPTRSKLPSLKLLVDYSHKSWDIPVRTAYYEEETDRMSQSTTLKSIGAAAYSDLKVTHKLSVLPQLGIRRVGFSGDELRGESSTTVWEIAVPLRLVQRDGGVLVRPYFTYESYKKRRSFGLELSASSL